MSGSVGIDFTFHWEKHREESSDWYLCRCEVEKHAYCFSAFMTPRTAREVGQLEQPRLYL